MTPVHSSYRITSLAFAALAPLTALATAAPYESYEGRAMGTRYVVKVANRPAAVSLETLAKLTSDEFERVEQIFSLFRDESELSRLNAAPAEAWIDVSTDLYTVAARALNLAETTDGAFDPTVRPLVRLWRIGDVSGGWKPPAASAIAAARQTIGYRLMRLRASPPAIRKLSPGVELDLNALVEGWAIDRVIDLLQNHGIKHALVELGGEFRGIGHAGNGRPWRVGIENPRSAAGIYATAKLENAALATSGDYRQQVEYEGKSYSHIIDPRTGAPIEHELTAVSVMADDALTADGWSTALLILGPVVGRAMAEREHLAASFVVHNPSDMHVLLTAEADYTFLIENRRWTVPTRPSAPRWLMPVMWLTSFFCLLALVVWHRRVRKRLDRLAGILVPWLKWDPEHRGPHEHNG